MPNVSRWIDTSDLDPAPTGATGVPANEGFFGELSGYSIYLREDLRAESSSDVDFDTDQVALRVSRRIDGVISQSGRMLRFT
jgi:HK97 family phage major capsid protein